MKNEDIKKYIIKEEKLRKKFDSSNLKLINKFFDDYGMPGLSVYVTEGYILFLVYKHEVLESECSRVTSIVRFIRALRYGIKFLDTGRIYYNIEDIKKDFLILTLSGLDKT